MRTLRPRVEKAAPRNNVIPTGRAPPAMGAANGNGAGRKLRVAVDVDEVLARFLLALNNFCAEKHDMQYEVRCRPRAVSPSSLRAGRADRGSVRRCFRLRSSRPQLPKLTRIPLR